ncbi:hypothetical protein [Adhaeribacter soli]|uniref:Uncharacterized protein n=1 Tax=Adhaeribacter soli TaxID=2607655 RepID=A0A5N1J0F8_9BACT|nr:hypothetical protein [Adhaeribacter soli]KAA9340110.1 hypothetical protein F0P94_07110 [Adhaeribacter soli]
MEEYMQAFDIYTFIDSIKVVPYAWNQSRVGKDDYWGVNIGFENKIIEDPYFIINRSLSHPKLGQVWRDSGYTSGSRQEEQIKKDGMKDEWKIAEEVEKEIRNNLLNSYCRNEHKQVLETFSKLNEKELKTYHFFIFRGITNFIIVPDISRCAGCSNSHIIDEGFDIESIIGLVQKDFLQEIIFNLFLKDEKKESIQLSFNQKQFKEFLINNANVLLKK